MPYITSMLMPRLRSDRPLPVPHGWKNLAFISQFVEIPDDVVFTVEYAVRAAQMAVYEPPGIERKIPPVTPHDKSLHAQFEALISSPKQLPPNRIAGNRRVPAVSQCHCTRPWASERNRRPGPETASIPKHLHAGTLIREVRLTGQHNGHQPIRVLEICRDPRCIRSCRMR